MKRFKADGEDSYDQLITILFFVLMIDVQVVSSSICKLTIFSV